MGYVVTATDGVHAAITLPVSTTSATLTGLNNDTPYTVSVLAVNAVGQSAAASASVTPKNEAPTLTASDDQATLYGHALNLQIAAHDPEAADHLTLSARGRPAGLAFKDNGDGAPALHPPALEGWAQATLPHSRITLRRRIEHHTTLRHVLHNRSVHNPETVRLAARNNAEWCDIVCRTHGIVGTFDTDMWSNAHRTPPYYPDAVTLDDAVSPERILSRVDTATPGCSIKDSFARVDLFAAGFRILFEAEWIYRPADTALSIDGSGTRWERIDDANLLALWEAARADDGSPTRLFRPELLDHEAVIALGARLGDRVVAGAILNRSESVVGVSNLFTTLGSLHDAWPECLAAVAEYVPGVPVVGYEDGAALAAAHDLGFTSVGPLRIWIAS